MPTPTYTLIEEQVLGSAQASVTFGSGGTLTQAYNNLVIEIVNLHETASASVRLRFNGDTGTNYSRTIVYGNGTSATSTRGTNEAQIPVGSSFSTTWWTSYVNVMLYSSTSVYKTSVYRNGGTNDSTTAGVGLWRSTSAITSFEVSVDSGKFAIGTTVRLWGIA